DRVRDQKPDHEGAECGDAHRTAARADSGCDDKHLRAGFRADAVDQPNAERCLDTVLLRFVDMFVLASEELGANEAEAVAHASEDEHPAASQPELLTTAKELPDGVEQIDSEHDERDAY